MKILLLPGAFKGTLSATKAGQILTQQLRGKHTLRSLPISDGGDGFIDFFRALDPNASLIKTRAKNAFLKTKNTSFLLLSDKKTAVIEVARICGLGTAKPHELDPLGASSYGVGQVILKAIGQGARKIYIGLGGVACNDGGAGMAVACGAKLFDKAGQKLALGAAPLLALSHADFTHVTQNLKGIEIWGVADVTNPLLGPHSSAKVFGPQKGATPAQVKLLDRALARWARVMMQSGGRTTAHTPSTAAAGAIAAGLYGCLGGELLLGSDFLFQKAHLEKQSKWADLIITSEGKLDAQTFYGKAPLAVLKLAKKHHKPVLFICGSADWKALQKQPLTHVCVAELVDFASSLQAAKKQAPRVFARLIKTLWP
ncbi:MAG: glycerate kinase [Elusimicrobiaceae bacterium]|nr:glycerate kinase [Elusimicrobiaceae bacterium]